MEEMGVLPYFKGILCHDHWKPYFKLDCQHALCNAHHLRELERAWEQDKQKWARDMRKLLLQINQAVDDAGVDSFSSIPQYHPKIPHTVTFFEKVSSL
jgi:transposase